MARVKVPKLPDPAEPMESLLDRRCAAFTRGQKRRDAEKWIPITFNETGPFAVVMFGDPHIDDDGCNMPLLREHVKLCKAPGIYAACVGDFTNNWVGRLARLYSDQETTKHTARRLARWFLKDAGLRWAFLLMGNHDEWNEGDAILSLIADTGVYFPAWEAQMEFRAGGDKWLVHAAHDFKGSSIHLPCYGGLRKARTESPAELFISGHRHSYGGASLADDERGRFIRVAMARGYKWADHHAKVNGYTQGTQAPSIMAVFNPGAKTRAGRVTLFEDLEIGAKLLKTLRDEAKPKSKGKKSAAKRERPKKKPATR